MIAITVNALYTAWRKRGTTRQLAMTIVACVASALLLLLALLWFNLRFSALQAGTSILEVALMLAYVSLWGCVVPFSATATYCLFTQPRDSNTAFRIPRPRSKRTTVGNAASAGSAGSISANLPRRLPGQPAPFVYSGEQPWGWLIHRNGRFQGLRMELKRSVISIGRDDDNDVWLEDDTSSRFHAELAWLNDQVYITDCNSMNGILLNGRRMRGTLPLSNGDFVEIGAHRFLFELAPHPESLSDLDDPLLPHLHRPLSASLTPDRFDSSAIPARRPAGTPAFPTRPLTDPVTPAPIFAANQSSPPPVPAQPSQPQQLGMCIIRTGQQAGTSFPLDRPQVLVGRMPNCDVRIDDPSLTIEYAQFTRSNEGTIINGAGVYLNESPLLAPHLLQAGDVIRIGAVYLEYAPFSEVKITPLPSMPQSSLPSLPAFPQGSPMHLRLPSKPK